MVTTILFKLLQLNVGKNIVPDYDDEELFDCMEITTLTTGATFGDLALLQDNAITSATIMTANKCEFACMDKKTVKYIGIKIFSFGNMREKISKKKLMPN